MLLYGKLGNVVLSGVACARLKTQEFLTEEDGKMGLRRRLVSAVPCQGHQTRNIIPILQKRNRGTRVRGPVQIKWQTQA